MGKAEKSWSGMRKYLEAEMLAETLKGRVRYHCSTAVGMDGCRFFELYVDGVCVKRFSWETVNSWFLSRDGLDQPGPMSIPDYWKDFWQRMEQFPMEQRSEYTDKEFCEALERYRASDIQQSVHASDPIVRMFALLDRRVGSRTLAGLQEEMLLQPEWLQEIYRLRLDAKKPDRRGASGPQTD
jgi:hypothetical protein